MRAIVKPCFTHTRSENYEIEKMGDFARPKDTKGLREPSYLAATGGADHLQELKGKVNPKRGVEEVKAFLAELQKNTNTRLEKVCDVCCDWYPDVLVGNGCVREA